MEVQDLASSIDGIARDFEAFKSANNDRLDQIERKGSADVVTSDQVDRINKGLSDRLDRLETALSRKGRAAIGESAVNEPDERKELLTFESFVKGRPVKPEEATITSEQYQAYSKALRKYLAKGEAALYDDEKRALELGYHTFPDAVKKALSVNVDAAGGYWVQPFMSDRILRRNFETSPMRSLASVVTIGTDAIEFPTDTNDATSGGWVGETDSRAETATPEIGVKRIPVHEQFANPRATQKIFDDAMFPVEEWLSDKIADKFTREENAAFVTGNGVDRPRGFLDYSGAATTDNDADRAWGVLQYVVTGASGAFDTSTVDATASPADELIDLQSKLKPVYRPNARWVMPRAVEAEARKLRNTTGEYLVTLNTGNITGVPLGSFLLLGYPIVNFEDMPALATNTFSVAFGDFQAGYQIVDRQGVRILRDPFTAKPFVQLYTTKRVGGDVVDFDAIKLLKFGTS